MKDCVLPNGAYCDKLERLPTFFFSLLLVDCYASCVSHVWQQVCNINAWPITAMGMQGLYGNHAKPTWYCISSFLIVEEQLFNIENYLY